MKSTVDKTILVADDNPECADALAQLLRMYDYEVFVAYDGLEAVEMAIEDHPDVAIVDITLPKLNGFSVARRLRASAGMASSQLIAITGWSAEDVADAAGQAGFGSFFVKPIDPVQLLSAIECGN